MKFTKDIFLLNVIIRLSFLYKLFKLHEFKKPLAETTQGDRLRDLQDIGVERKKPDVRECAVLNMATRWQGDSARQNPSSAEPWRC